MCLHGGLFMYEYRCLQSQETGMRSLELVTQSASDPTWVLGAELRPSKRAVCAPKCGVISPPPAAFCLGFSFCVKASMNPAHS